MNASYLKKLPFILLVIFPLNAFSSPVLQDITFSYGHYKEIDFENPTLNSLFESFITSIHEKDLAYNDMRDNYSELYEKKKRDEEVRSRYKPEDMKALSEYRVNFEESDNLKSLRAAFFEKEVFMFNDFLKSIKASKAIPDINKTMMLDASRKLHRAYSAFSDNYRYFSEVTDRVCFSKSAKDIEDSDLKYSNDYCGALYEDFNKDFALEFRSFSSNGLDFLISRYLGTLHKGDFLKSLQMKIDAYERYQDSRKNN